MLTIDNPLTTAYRIGVASNLVGAQEDANLLGGDLDPHRLTDQTPRDAVGVSVDLNAGVGLHPPGELTDRHKGGAAVDRLKGSGFLADEPLDRPLAGGAMDTQIGDRAHPLAQVRLERVPGGKGASGDRVPLDVPHAVLVLALRACSVRRTGSGPKAPMASEGEELAVEGDGAGLRVVVRHERSSVIEQDLRGNPAKVPERCLDTRHPAALSLVQERRDEAAARVPEGRHEQIHLRTLIADRDAHLAEVDLQLLAGRSLKTHRRLGDRRELAPVARHRSFHGAQAHLDPVLAPELLAHDIRIASVLQKSITEPALKSHQLPSPRALRIWRPAALAQVPLHGVTATAKLLGNALRPPSQRLQSQHCRHRLWLLHLLGSRIHPKDRSMPPVHRCPSYRQRGVSFTCRPGVSFTCRLTNGLAYGRRASITSSSQYANPSTQPNWRASSRLARRVRLAPIDTKTVALWPAFAGDSDTRKSAQNAASEDFPALRHRRARSPGERVPDRQRASLTKGSHSCCRRSGKGAVVRSPQILQSAELSVRVPHRLGSR